MFVLDTLAKEKKCWNSNALRLLDHISSEANIPNTFCFCRRSVTWNLKPFVSETIAVIRKTNHQNMIIQFLKKVPANLFHIWTHVKSSLRIARLSAEFEGADFSGSNTLDNQNQDLFSFGEWKRTGPEHICWNVSYVWTNKWAETGRNQHAELVTNYRWKCEYWKTKNTDICSVWNPKKL